MAIARARPRPVLTPEFCKGCGRCIEACALNCIEAGTKIDPRSGLIPVVLDLTHCTGCGLCLDACPEPFGLWARSEAPAPERDAPPLPVDVPDTLVPLPEGHRYLGFIFSRADTPAEAEAALRQAHACLRFVIR